MGNQLNFENLDDYLHTKKEIHADEQSLWQPASYIAPFTSIILLTSTGNYY